MTKKFFFEIDGVDISSFISEKGIKYTRNDIDSANAGRNLAGTMNRGRVVTKVKLEVSCRPMTQEQAQILLNLIYPEYVYVHYIDPRLGERHVQFYSNNVPATFARAVPEHDEEGNEMFNLQWEEISFPLVER